MTDDQVRAWAARPGPSKVLAVARSRAERGGQLARGSLRVPLSPQERKDVGALLGVDWVASGRDVSVAALRDALTARGTTIVDLLAATGPLRDRRAEKARAHALADAERAHARSMLEAAGIDGANAAVVLARRGAPTAGTGELRRLAEHVAKTWTALPGPAPSPRVALAVLAVDLFGDPHALDRSTILGRTVARLAIGTTRDVGQTPDDIGRADTWRAAWDAVGVDTDTVSSTVLVLNLPLDGHARAAHLTCAAGAEPVWLTLRSLDGEWRPQPAVTDVWVCENPTILEAAATDLGARCPPLVCTFGRPSSASIRLLRHLGRSGVRVHVRADDDRAGQSIVAQLLASVPGAQLWRFTPRPPDDASHDPRYEEQLLRTLHADLRAAAAVSSPRT